MKEVKLQKYPAYKDSGVEWLGEIPEQWEVIRIKNLFREINERSQKGDEELLSVSQYTGVTKKSDKLDDGDLLTNASTLEGYKRVYINDLVSNIMLAWNGSLGFSPFNGITSPAYSIYRLKIEGDFRFFHYLFRTELYKSEFKRNSSGVIESRLRLYTDDFFRISSILPPISEQTVIANFLDNKTALIDKAIALKEKQIELLKERRQILIHRAVTRGIGSLSGAETPDVKLKDSGVEWIGEIPEHWEVKRLKHLAKNIISGPFGSSLIKDEYVKEGYKIYGQEQVIPNDFTIGDYYIKESKFKKMLRYEIFKDDILISCVGTYGKIALVPEIFQKGIINPRLIKITPLYDFIIPRYLQEILLSPFCFSQFEQVSRGGTMGVINIELLSQLIIIIPSIEEQEAILSFLEEGKLKIDSAISLKEKEIEKLKEYKSVLINEAVSGKIKVG